MKTIIHRYSYNTRNADEAKTYAALQKRLLAEIKEGVRGSWMHCISDRAAKHSPGSEEITLETQHLFSNQWNTPTDRVFDWFEAAEFGDRKHLKRGHWLEMTQEMRDIRRNTLKCGYTGQQFPADCGLKFNETAQGLGSEYLKQRELHLLRLRPIDAEERDSEPLTADELAYLLPKYLAAQKEGAATRAGRAKAKAREDVLSTYHAETTISEKQLRDATTKRDGLLWLMDRGFSTDNVIYYNHSGVFCFGWRSPLSAEEKSKLLDVLSEFPFAYEFDKKPLRG